MARPSEYNENYPSQVRAYIEQCKDVEEQKIITDGDKSTSYKYKYKVKLPTIEGLALFLKIATSTVYEWEKIHPAFSEVISELRQEQADRLINMGLSGDYNPVITKVLLTKHGYVEAKELTGKDGEALYPQPILDITKQKSSSVSQVAEESQD